MSDRASIYILRCRDGSLYVGLTQRPVEARVSEHNSGTIPGYTANRRPVELLHSEAYLRLDEAIAAERRIKGWSRAKKIAYIAGEFAALRDFATGRRDVGKAGRGLHDGGASFETPPPAAPQDDGG